MSDSKKSNESQVLKGEEGLLLDHNYDGIQELDHVLPRWWLWILYSTIIFAAWYMGYYMSGRGPTPQQELALALQKIEASKPEIPALNENSDDVLLAAYKDPAKLKHGSEVFMGKCFACHGDKGQGVVGPNLTDDYWISGTGSLKDIAAVVSNGVPAKGMPPWGSILTPDESRDVVAFVHSLHGTNPANPKAPQGEKQNFKD